MTQMPPVASNAIFEPSGDHVGLPGEAKPGERLPPALVEISEEVA